MAEISPLRRRMIEDMTVRNLSPAPRGRGRVARPFGFALTDPDMRLSRTRLFPEVTRMRLSVASRDE